MGVRLCLAKDRFRAPAGHARGLLSDATARSKPLRPRPPLHGSPLNPGLLPVDPGPRTRDPAPPTPEQITTPPRQLDLGLNTSFSVDLWWLDRSDVEDGYRIERRGFGSDDPWEVIGEIGPVTDPLGRFTDGPTDIVGSGTRSGQRYCYRVVPFNEHGSPTDVPQLCTRLNVNLKARPIDEVPDGWVVSRSGSEGWAPIESAESLPPQPTPWGTKLRATSTPTERSRFWSSTSSAIDTSTSAGSDSAASRCSATADDSTGYPRTSDPETSANSDTRKTPVPSICIGWPQQKAKRSPSPPRRGISQRCRLRIEVVEGPPSDRRPPAAGATARSAPGWRWRW